MPPKTRGKSKAPKVEKVEKFGFVSEKVIEKMFGKQKKSQVLITNPEEPKPEEIEEIETVPVEEPQKSDVPVEEPLLQPKSEEIETVPVEEPQKSDVPVEEPQKIISEKEPTVSLVEETHGAEVPQQSEIVEGLKQKGEQTLVELKEMGVSKAQELISTVQKKIMEYPAASKVALVGGLTIPIAVGSAIAGREIYQYVKEKLEEKEKPKEEK